MKTMTAYETKKIIYETIVKEIYINPETAHALTQVIYDNLQAAQQSEQANLLPCGHSSDSLGGFGGCNPNGSCMECEASKSN